MIHSLSVTYLAKIIGFSLLLFFISGVNCCFDIQNADPVYVELPEPVKISFEEIQNRGTLRMITRYSSTSYFLLDGMDRGFEYELVSRFARENGLKVEVVLIGSHEDPLQFLESGKGDLIADHFVINKELLDQVAFSTPYDFISLTNEIEVTKGENLSNPKFPGKKIIGLETHQFQYPVHSFGKKSTLKTVEKNDSIAWVTHKSAPKLKQIMDEFLGKHIRVRQSDGTTLRSAYLNNLRNRYFKDTRYEKRYYSRAYDAIYTGYLSPYDELVKSIAKEAGVDWKLVIAVMAQESAFDPDAESLAGARGLMQIIPRFSSVEDKEELYEPETNIREGVRYLKKHLTREIHLDSLNRHSMALAAYNVGMGNIADARKLAVRLGKDPDEWQNISDALLKLMDPEYYQHARYGYKKGIETVNYVEDVLNRYSRYQAVYKMSALFEEGDISEMIVQTNHGSTNSLLPLRSPAVNATVAFTMQNSRAGSNDLKRYFTNVFQRPVTL